MTDHSSAASQAATPPQRAEAWIASGDQLLDENRFAETLAAYEQARLLTPDDPDVYCSIGFVLRRLRRKDESTAAYETALALCEAALRLAPDHPEHYRKQGDVLCWLRREAAALATYDALIQLDPQEPAAYCEKADALFIFDHDQAGRDVYHVAIKLDPARAETYLSYARSLHRNLHRDALIVCEQAIALNPHDDTAWSLKSAILWESGRYQESLVAIDEAIRLAPDVQRHHGSRAMVLCYIVPAGQARASRRRKQANSPENV